MRQSSVPSVPQRTDVPRATSEPAATGADVDPITFTLLLSRFTSICEEMTATLELSAQSAMYALCRDFDCAVHDAQGRQLATVESLPVHTITMHLVLREIAKVFDGDINPGDVFFCNDPYSGNTHVADIVTAAPVFYGGKMMFWSIARGHQLDIGGFQPSSVIPAAQNVYQEGLIIPPIKLAEDGRIREDIKRLYFANVRYRNLLEGDMLAQLGSIEKGRQRLVELCEEYGPQLIEECIEAMMHYVSARTRAEIDRMPSGTFTGEGWIDSDGVDKLDIPIKVRIDIGNGKIKVDYEGSGAQAKGGLNGSIATSTAAAAAPFMTYFSTDIPHNQAKIDTIEVKLPKGSICNPNFPASTSCATIIPSDMMSDAIHKALGAAMPELVLAGTTRCANVPQFAGEADWDGKPWGIMLFNNTGGLGAAADTDGWPLAESVAALGGMRAQSIEQIELLNPVLVESLEIEADSMGLGHHIGGPGVRMVLRPLNGQIDCITFGDGCRNPPHGIAGGTPGSGGGQYVEDLKAGKRRFFSATGSVKVGMHERYVGVSTGGGGHGNPLEREIETVRRNIRDGLISRKKAAEVFGVIVDNARDPKVLAAETAKRRAQLAGVSRPSVDPTGPAAGHWAEDQMRDGDVFLLNPV